MERQVKGVGVPVFISGDVTSAAVALAAATARTATYLRANMVVRWVAGEGWLCFGARENLISTVRLEMARDGAEEHEEEER